MNNENPICCKYSGPGLIIYSAFLSIIISKNMTSEEMDLLSNLLQAVGQNLGILSATNSYCESKKKEAN